MLTGVARINKTRQQCRLTQICAAVLKHIVRTGEVQGVESVQLRFVCRGGAKTFLAGPRNHSIEIRISINTCITRRPCFCLPSSATTRQMRLSKSNRESPSVRLLASLDDCCRCVLVGWRNAQKRAQALSMRCIKYPHNCRVCFSWMSGGVVFYPWLTDRQTAISAAARKSVAYRASARSGVALLHYPEGERGQPACAAARKWIGPVTQG